MSKKRKVEGNKFGGEVLKGGGNYRPRARPRNPWAGLDSDTAAKADNTTSPPSECAHVGDGPSVTSHNEASPAAATSQARVRKRALPADAPEIDPHPSTPQEPPTATSTPRATATEKGGKGEGGSTYQNNTIVSIRRTSRPVSMLRDVQVAVHTHAQVPT